MPDTKKTESVTNGVPKNDELRPETREKNDLKPEKRLGS